MTALRRTVATLSWFLLVACGARSSLVERGDVESATPSGGASDAGPRARTDAGGTRDGGADAAGEVGSCQPEDLSTWRVDRYRAEGDYERAVASVSGAPWVALKVRGGNVILAELDVDPAQGGIVFRSRVEIADSPVYPVALDVDDRRSVIVTTSGINWNGDVTLFRVDRTDGSVMRVPLDQAPPGTAFTVSASLGLAGDHVVVAYARLVDARLGTIELRDDRLEVVKSMSVEATSFTAVRSSATAIDVFTGGATRVRAEAGALTPQPVDPTWQVIGGLDGFLVEMGAQIRMTRGREVWSAAWPHTQLSPPAVMRLDGDRAAFSLETEMTAVVGHVTDSGLEWLRIEAGPDAPGLGAGLMPLIARGRLGVFYLGIEIPRPEQPLRYFGRACP